MKQMKDLTVYKPNQLIEIEGGYLTTLNLLAYNYVLHRLQNSTTNNLIITGAEFFKELELSKNYDDLIRYFDSLRKISVVSRDKKGRLWGAFNLISAFKRLDDGSFYIEVPNLIFNSLCKKDNLYYTTIELLEQKAFKSIHTAILYEIFKKYKNINIPIFTLSELKKITNTVDRYENYKDFKRYVLNKAILELNLFDNKYSYNFEEERLGRKVDKIKFIRTEKVNEKIIFSEKLIKAIEKYRKNRFIDSSYSQRAMEKILQKYEEKDIIRGLGELYKYNSEIKSFSKILTSKIEDIKNSKMDKIKEKQGYVLCQEKIETSFKNDFIEPRKSDLDIEKENLANLIINSGLPTMQRIELMSKLAKIDNLNELKTFKIKGD